MREAEIHLDPARSSSLPQRFTAEHLIAEAKRWRRRLHEIPELAFDENCTGDFIADILTSAGVEVHRGIGRTGVFGVLRSGSCHRAIGLRAEMDALPIQEANEFLHRSKHSGCMHACGHDGHTAILLGAASHLARTRAFDGTVHFIFQPAEETGGGALAMVNDGLFERFPCDALYAMHNRPSLALGRFAVRSGPAMAAGGFFDICVRGKSAHAARPAAGIEALLAGARIVSALQGVVARTLAPAEPAVVSITQFHAGNTYNVMPEEARIAGTLRACSHAAMTEIERALRLTAESTAQSLGAAARIDVRWAFPPTINDSDEADFVAKVCDSLGRYHRRTPLERQPREIRMSGPWRSW